MTALDHSAPRTTMADRAAKRRAAHRSARERRIRRSLDGVVASYIRELNRGQPRARAR
jgi:hypothetical protein